MSSTTLSLPIDEFVNAKLNAMLETDKLAELINEKVERAVNKSIDDAMGYSSDFKKNLDGYINKSLQVNFDDLGFEGYHETFLRMIAKTYQDSVQSEHLEKVKKMTEEILANPPEVVTLSEVIKGVKEKALEKRGEEYDSYEEYGEITCIIKDSYSSFKYIELDPKPNKSGYECHYRIGLHKRNASWEVFNLDIGGKSDEKDLFVGRYYGLERLLFKAKCASSKFEFDIEENALDLSYELPEEECHC